MFEVRRAGSLKRPLGGCLLVACLQAAAVLRRPLLLPCAARHQLLLPRCCAAQEFILRPLWRQAEKAPQGAAGSESGIAGLLRERRREVLTAAAILTAAAAGVLAWRWRKHNAQAFVAG